MEHVLGIYKSWKQLVVFWLVAPPVVRLPDPVEEVRQELDKDQAATFYTTTDAVQQTETESAAALVQGRRVHLCTPTGALTQQFPREPPLSNMGAKVKNDANVPEVPYATRVCTSGVRPNPTKEEKLLRNGAEKLPPDEFVKLLPELANRGLFCLRRGDERPHPPTAPGAIAELARLRCRLLGDAVVEEAKIFPPIPVA